MSEDCYDYYRFCRVWLHVVSGLDRQNWWTKHKPDRQADRMKQRMKDASEMIQRWPRMDLDLRVGPSMGSATKFCGYWPIKFGSGFKVCVCVYNRAGRICWIHKMRVSSGQPFDEEGLGSCRSENNWSAWTWSEMIVDESGLEDSFCKHIFIDYANSLSHTKLLSIFNLTNK